MSLNAYRIWSVPDGACYDSHVQAATPQEALETAVAGFPGRYLVAKTNDGYSNNHGEFGVFDVKPAKGYVVEKVSL